jgi:hypothetical protein
LDRLQKTAAHMTNQTKQLNLSPEAGPVTTSAEKKQVEERVAVGVTIVYEAIRREGEVELRRPAAAWAWSALAAGLSMGFSFLAEALLAAGYLGASDRQSWLQRWVSHRSLGATATLYRKYAHRGSPCPLAQLLHR